MALTQINPALFAGSSNTTAVIQSNGTTAITVDSSQNVGVGVTSPAAKLDVSTSTSYGGIKINGANGASVNLYQPQSNASARNYQLLTNWEAWGTLDFQRSVDNATAPSVTLMSLNNAGTVVLKGGAVSNSGVGIAFPATQVSSSDANTLDDYEEGTWSPKVTFGGSDSSGQTGTFAGFYTKTGNQVFATALINLTNKGSATGTMGIGGLPFTSSSSSNYRAVSSSMNWDTLATSYVYMYALLSVGGTNMEVLGITAAAASNGTNPTQANINNNSNFRISITYQV